MNKINDINNINLNEKLNYLINNDIWKIDIKQINNNKILTIFNQLQKYELQLNNEKKNKLKFNINENYDIEIINEDKKNIKKKINKIKKENITYLKTHAECFYEYHLLINDILKNKKTIYNYSDWTLEKNNNKNILISAELLNEHLDIFSKNINYTNINSKKLDITSTINKLKYNLDLISNKLIYFINESVKNDKIYLLLDTENILKSFKIQNIIKKNIDKNEFNEYFNIWKNGYFKEDIDINLYNNISISDYSSKTKYIEPFTSLGLDIKLKYKLIKIIIDNYLLNFNTINILTHNHNIINNNLEINSEIKSESNLDENLDENNNFIIDNNLFLSILYDKNDIREQDDHILLFIYTFLKKYNYKIIILTNDKYRWYNNFDLTSIKNFKFFYDFDMCKLNLIIDKANTSDIYKINNKYYSFSLINIPIIDNIFENNLSLKDFIKNIEVITKLISIENLENILKYFFILSIYDEIKIHIYEEIIDSLINITLDIKKIFDNIFNFLKKNTKNEIFKISIQSNNDYFNEINFNIIEKYKIIIEIFSLIKIIEFKFLLLNKNIIIKHIDLFTILIDINDKIHDNLYKIRKLSNSKSNCSILFKNLNSCFIYIKKQGYLKKNF